MSSNPAGGMTVLVVMPLAEQRGGAEFSLRLLVEHGRGRGVEWVVVFLQDGPMVGDFRRLGVRAIVIDAGRLRQPHRTIAAVAQIYRVARREQARMIVGWMTKGHVYGGLAARLAGRPAIWYQHGMPELDHWLERLGSVLPAGGVITVSQAAARALHALGTGHRQHMVYPGVDLDRFSVGRRISSEEQRALLGLPSGGPLVGTVARLQSGKGVDILIDAIELLRQSHPQLHCVIVGGTHDLEPEYAEMLKGKVTSLRLDRHVSFVGSQRNVPDWMQAMDVVVQASDREAFGIAVVEAMALGRPVIAGSGGPREIVTHGVDGLLVPFGDRAALAAALRRYLDDPAFANGVGVAARRRAADFAAPRYAQNVITALRELSA